MSVVDLDEVRIVLERRLPEWLPRQRWYGAGVAIRAVHCEELRALDGDAPVVAICIVRVEDEDGASVRYNIPVAAGWSDGLRPSDPRAVIHEDGGALVFDALADARTAAPLWRILAEARTVQLGSGRLVGASDGLDPGTMDINPLVREQSNTSLVVGKEHLLKVMRTVVFEPSVELEMTRALQQTGFANVAPAQGWLHYERDGQDHGALLALTQRFLHNGTEGWTMALTSLRDLYADAEERGASDVSQRVQAVEEAGGSFTGEAARLGDITARMHLALAGARGHDLAPRSIDAAMLNGWADEILVDLDTLIAVEDEVVAALPDHRAALEARITAIRTLRDPGLAIRIHGDFHLGQVLRTDAGWTVLDFEGEPLRSVEHRRRRHSPLRDVAGMLRSFDYAAEVALIERTTPADPVWSDLVAHGRSWAWANREAFWAAYVDRTANTVLLPDPGAALTLRRAFEIQKAVYEVGYELAHRPQWAAVPLSFLLEATP